jgi:hypothetical protein
MLSSRMGQIVFVVLGLNDRYSNSRHVLSGRLFHFSDQKIQPRHGPLHSDLQLRLPTENSKLTRTLGNRFSEFCKKRLNFKYGVILHRKCPCKKAGKGV